MKKSIGLIAATTLLLVALAGCRTTPGPSGGLAASGNESAEGREHSRVGAVASARSTNVAAPTRPVSYEQPLAPSAQPSQLASADDIAYGPSTVERLNAYAMANNPELQAARYRASSLAARVPQVRSLPDPRLSANIFIEQIQTAAGPQDASLALSQRVPWFGKRALRGAVAWQGAMAAYAEASAVALRVREAVYRDYFALYLAERSIDETKRLRPRLKDVIEVARSRYKVSAPGAGLDSVLQAEVELARLENRLAELQRARRTAEARLVATLHLPPGTAIQTAEPSRSRPLAHEVNVLVGLAEQCQPELEARRHEVAGARTAAQLARRERWPDVDVGAQWYSIGDEGLSPFADGRDAASVMVGMNLPIYRGRLDAQVREAQCATAASRRRYLAARDRLQAEVAALAAEFDQHERMLRIVETRILPKAAQSLDLAVEAYRTGRQEFQQLIDVYRTLLRSRIERHEHLAAREQALASLQRAVGCSITATDLKDGTAKVPEPEAIPQVPVPQ